jgi:hypothetical protein
MGDTDFNSFSGDLENTPHGAVHCGMVTGSCPNGLMGSVPVAALDPIFYAHHTNVDRLYDCWLNVDATNRLPNDPAQLGTMFTFVDADGSTPQRRVGDMLTTTQLGYSYGSGGGCPAALRTAATMIAAGAAETLAVAGPSRISGASTTVPLAVREGLAPRLGAAVPGRTYLTIEGVQYDKAPGGLYDVFLQGAAGRREHVGVINFFNLVPAGSGGHAAHRGQGATRANFRFDVTDAIRRLNLSRDAQPSLVFEPTNGLAGSTAEAIAPQMNAEANVRFESARLVSSP